MKMNLVLEISIALYIFIKAVCIFKAQEENNLISGLSILVIIVSCMSIIVSSTNAGIIVVKMILSAF